MQPLNPSLARKTVKRYCCSTCWGDLEIHPDPIDDNFKLVVCKSCQEQTKGYVTKYYVERRRNDSEFEKVDAVNLLRHLGIIENKLAGKTESELLSELGF